MGRVCMRLWFGLVLRLETVVVMFGADEGGRGKGVDGMLYSC